MFLVLKHLVAHWTAMLDVCQGRLREDYKQCLKSVMAGCTWRMISSCSSFIRAVLFCGLGGGADVKGGQGKASHNHEHNAKMCGHERSRVAKCL